MPQQHGQKNSALIGPIAHACLPLLLVDYCSLHRSAAIISSARTAEEASGSTIHQERRRSIKVEDIAVRSPTLKVRYL